jgi:hypothetical protein
LLKKNDRKSYPIKFVCDTCRYEQIAYVSVKPLNWKFGARFICNECVDKPELFMDKELDFDV